MLLHSISEEYCHLKQHDSLSPLLIANVFILVIQIKRNKNIFIIKYLIIGGKFKI